MAFTASSDADIDGDMVLQTWGYRKVIGGGAPVASKNQGNGACAFTSVADETVGPCQPEYGRSIF